MRGGLQREETGSGNEYESATLYRKVKQSTDYTIIELIRGVRMRRAGVLLKTKQYAVQEVAEMVGYNDIPTFRKHFVDAFGTTPSTYE